MSLAEESAEYSSQFLLRRPCPACEGTLGIIDRRNGQACVFCAHCERFQYNAPRVETGEKQRSVSTVHDGISASQRSRVLVRANGLCELCGATGYLHVGHVLSVKDGLELGFTEFELNHDENLCCLCEECNLGMGPKSITLSLFAGLLRRRLRDL